MKITAAAMSAVCLVSCGAVIESGDGDPDRPSVKPDKGAAVTEITQPTTAAPTVPTSDPFDISVPADYKLPQKYVIDGFETVLQNPEFPSGCEVTSLTQTLCFLGFKVDKLTLAYEYMPSDPYGDGLTDRAYVGDPSKDGFGCNANVIVQTADKYFTAVDSPCFANDLTGVELDAVFAQVSCGRPVITWVTTDMIEAYPEYVWTTDSGEELIFNWYQHCLTVYGYDLGEGLVYAADPLKGNVTYPIDKFRKVYEILGRQAVVISGDASVKGHHVTTDAERSVTALTASERVEIDGIPDEPYAGYVYEEVPVQETSETTGPVTEPSDVPGGTRNDTPETAPPTEQTAVTDGRSSQ